MRFGKLLCIYGAAVFAVLIVLSLVFVRLHEGALRASAPHSVMYEVTSPKLSLGIMYWDPTIPPDKGLKIWVVGPWTHNFTVSSDYGGNLSVAAWSDTDEGGLVTVRIYVDGKLVDEDTEFSDCTDDTSLSVASWRLE